MAKKATFTQDGFPTGFYDTAINNNIPSSAIEITVDQWIEFISNPCRRKFNGSIVVEYTPPEITFPVIETIKSEACKVILSIAPDYKQRNMTARAVEIADAKAQGTATAGDLAESDVIRGVWAKIKAVRAKSDELEAQHIEAGNDLTAQDLETINAALEAAGE